jgi:hypothetical protein
MFYFGISISEPNPNRKYNPKTSKQWDACQVLHDSMSLEMPEIDSKGQSTPYTRDLTCIRSGSGSVWVFIYFIIFCIKNLL